MVSGSRRGRRLAQGGRRQASRVGLRAGAEAWDGGVLQLRRLVHHHLDSVGMPDPVLLRDGPRRAPNDALGLAPGGRARADRRTGHGGGLLVLPDGWRSVLLGGQTSARKKWACMVVVHR